MEDLFAIERKLSLVMQPSSSVEKIRLVAKARDDLRKLMRKAGYRGNF